MTTFGMSTPFGGEWRCLDRRPYREPSRREHRRECEAAQPHDQEVDSVAESAVPDVLARGLRCVLRSIPLDSYALGAGTTGGLDAKVPPPELLASTRRRSEFRRNPFRHLSPF